MTEAFLDQASSKFSLSFPDTGGVVDEFRRQIRACVKLLTSPYGKLLSTLLGGIQIDGQLAEAFRLRWLEPRRREAKEVLRRGIDRGEPRQGSIRKRSSTRCMGLSTFDCSSVTSA